MAWIFKKIDSVLSVTGDTQCSRFIPAGQDLNGADTRARKGCEVRHAKDFFYYSQRSDIVYLKRFPAFTSWLPS